MKEKIKYFSTDKMYLVNRIPKNKRTRVLYFVFLVTSFIALIAGGYLLFDSVSINGKKINVRYNEIGTADYTVYLKDNQYYETDYLQSGMKYVASLIKTINTKFNYEVHSNQNVNYSYNYKITGTLQILDRENPDKVLYSREEDLIPEENQTVSSNNFVINEDIDIDYNKYNNIVSRYKSDYGLSVNAQLVVAMDLNVYGDYDKDDDKIQKDNKLQITIPLSLQTVDITIDTENINNTGTLSTSTGNTITNIPGFVVAIVLLALCVPGFIQGRKYYKEYKSNNIYNITVDRILREFDRLIVTGTSSINEKKYQNKFYPQKFSEMVDAAENLNAPILFYEVIPNEKCFFIIVKDDTLYKFRLTRAFLEKEELDKNESITTENAEVEENKNIKPQVEEEVVEEKHQEEPQEEDKKEEKEETELLKW